MQTVLAILLSLSWLFSDPEAPTSEIIELHDQIKTYYQTNLDSAAKVANHALAKSEELGDAFGLAQSHFIVGDIASKQGKTSESVTHYLDALKKFMPIENIESLSFQANICLSLGKIYRQHSRLVEAIDFYDKGLGFATESLDQKVFVKLLHNKAVLYRKIGESEKAIELLSNKLEMIEPYNHKEKLFAYNQIGLAYRDLGNINQALSYYNKILTLDKTAIPSLHRGQAYHNMANIYVQQTDYTKSWKCFNKALEELELLGMEKDLFITYQDMANLALLQNRKKLALSYAEKATSLLDKVPHTPEYYDQYHLLSNCIGESNPKQALAYSNQYFAENEVFIDLQEELIAMGRWYKMDLITMNYFNEQRHLEQQERLYLLIACSLIILLVASFSSTRLWKIYRYKSPQVALSLIKNQKEMIYLLDSFRNEKEELKRQQKQERKR